MTARAFLVAAALATLPAAAQAQALEPWGQTDLWDIMVDPTLGNGCLIQADFDNDVTIRVGFDRANGGGYVAAFNYNWGDIVDGEVYPVLFDLDGQEYEGEAVGLYLNEVPGAVITFDNPDFLFDIAARQIMTLYNEGGEVMAIDLTGTLVALEGALECQDEMG